MSETQPFPSFIMDSQLPESQDVEVFVVSRFYSLVACVEMLGILSIKKIAKKQAIKARKEKMRGTINAKVMKWPPSF